MSKKTKLISRFLSMPKDFHYDETVKLLSHFEFYPIKIGKTSGSRVRFENEKKELTIMMHKPHPSGIMKRYQLKQIKEILDI